MTGRLPGGAFEHHRALWLDSDLTDAAHLAAMDALLQRSLESDDASPATVAAQALGVCLLARGAQVSVDALPLALTGLDAVEMHAGTESGHEREALLAVCAAENHGAAGRRLDALGMVRRARLALEGVERPGPAALYAAMLTLLREGELSESGRDRMRAAQSYAECAAHAAALLDAGASADEGLVAVLGEDVPDRLRGTVLRDAASARVVSLAGRVRSLVPPIGGGIGSPAAGAVAREAAAAIALHGLPARLRPLDLIETLIALPADEAAALGSYVTERTGTDGTAVVLAARAHGLAVRGHEEEAADLHEQAGEAADEGASPETAAVVRGLDLLDSSDEDEDLRDAVAEEFLLALSDLASAETGAAGRPDARAGVLLEASIATAIAHVAAAASDGKEATVARVRLGLLIDILREPRWQPVVPDLHLDPAATLALAGEAWELSLDRPGRIARALRDRAGTAVLVVQRVSDRTLFIAIDEDGPSSALAGPGYRDALRALAGSGEGEAEGRRAFDALPAMVQRLLRSRSHVLIVPDARVQDGAVAFQRMHDGHGVLGARHTLEHASSLRSAMRELEPEHDAVTRLLDVFADPVGEPTDRVRSFEAVRDAPETRAGDPRAAAALALALAMTRLDACEPDEADWAVDRLIAAADELEHRTAGALLRAVRARGLGRGGAEDERRLAALDEALPWLAEACTRGPAWERLHADLGAEREAVALRVRIAGEGRAHPDEETGGAQRPAPS